MRDHNRSKELFPGDLLKAAGIEQIIKNNPTWCARAIKSVQQFIKEEKMKQGPQPFTIEDWRDWANLPDPPHDNLWGAFWNSLARMKPRWIKFTGRMLKTRRDVAHSTLVQEWLPGEAFGNF
jgi:hypothetical protein